jgi:Flp pilus assembly protein TadG
MRNPFSQLRLFKFLGRMRRDQRGVSAVAFAISFAVLTPMALGVFDVYQSTEQRGKLQDALDAAALYAAKSNAVTTADINTVGQKALTANLQLIQGATLKDANFTLTDNVKVTAVASVALPAYAPMEYTHTPVTVNSEVVRGGNNIEVAMVLDNSTSMAGASLTSLKSAANQLIDLVVSDSQTPFYSKVSVVPYGNGVNAGAYADTARGPILSAADVACANNANGLGCPNYKFANSSNGQNRTLPSSTCVSERTGSEAYTDAPPTTALVGLNYAVPYVNSSNPGNPCISAKMAPLSSNKSDLHDSVNALTSCCSTGGHIGVAWGWYTLSPNWNSVFTGSSKPAAYTAPNTIKALILMTDGEYNSVYCKGVIAKIGTNSTATTGSGDPLDHINCLGTNGKDAYAQAQALCTAMKTPPNNVVIYTVGLNLANANAQTLVANCATDAKHVYLPANGAQLQIAFQQIAANLNRLRLSH